MSEVFEEHRSHLRGVAYRMLGSLHEADDAVQEAWLRLHRSDTAEVTNLRGWLTTVVARVCLDMLRARKARREEPAEHAPDGSSTQAEDERALAESVGRALLVMLDTLSPAERLAFVLHDMFNVAFEEIAPIIGKSSAAARQLASRARRRVRGAAQPDDAELVRQRDVVTAFLTALRAGDLQGVLAVLDPDVSVRTAGQPETRGALTWAKGAVAYGKLAEGVVPALVDGHVGLMFAPKGTVLRALTFVLRGDRITDVEVIMDPARLATMEIEPLAID